VKRRRQPACDDRSTSRAATAGARRSCCCRCSISSVRSRPRGREGGGAAAGANRL